MNTDNIERAEQIYIRTGVEKELFSMLHLFKVGSATAKGIVKSIELQGLNDPENPVTSKSIYAVLLRSPFINRERRRLKQSGIRLNFYSLKPEIRKILEQMLNSKEDIIDYNKLLYPGAEDNEKLLSN